MNILVTAGNTQIPIDRVRAITNIFTGRTGTRIALAAYDRGHRVTLLTSHPELVAEMSRQESLSPEWCTLRPYRTFDELHKSLEAEIRQAGYDAVIHSAAVSDYRPAGIYAPAADTRFDPATGRWHAPAGEPATLHDRVAGKVKSDEKELWLRMVRTPKLIDFVRQNWGLGGILVKFKLEVGVSQEHLLEIAERSRRQSQADLMVANTLEGANEWAFVGPLGGEYVKIRRPDLAWRLLDAVESLHEERRRG